MCRPRRAPATVRQARSTVLVGWVLSEWVKLGERGFATWFGGAVGELPEGLYESLLTSRLGRQLAENATMAPEIRAVDAAEQPEVLARHIRDAAFRALSAQRDPAKRVELVNAMLGMLDQLDDSASGDPRQLLSLSRAAAPGLLRSRSSGRRSRCPTPRC